MWFPQFLSNNFLTDLFDLIDETLKGAANLGQKKYGRYGYKKLSPHFSRAPKLEPHHLKFSIIHKILWKFGLNLKKYN